ncbi:MAG: hypothetical protein M3Z64_09450 [Verrucomicrobiota bacterium]|nr:hypothetical protein [Verrucomicrobiota bacterium]
MKKKMLFICVHNSARTRMAEAFLNEICGDEFEAESAGLDPGNLRRAMPSRSEGSLEAKLQRTREVRDAIKAKIES